MINEIKKFKIDVVNAMNFIFFNETPLSLLINIASTPNIGVKSKDDNNIYKTKRINTSISYRMIMYQLYF